MRSLRRRINNSPSMMSLEALEIDWVEIDVLRHSRDERMLIQSVVGCCTAHGCHQHLG